MQAKNKIFLVTGAGSGIGRQLVIFLLRNGAQVAAVDSNRQALDETLSLAGTDSRHLGLFHCDISQKEDVRQLHQDVIIRFGFLDGLMNVAGIIQPFVSINNITDEVIQHVMDVNFYGTVNMTRTFLPHLINRPEAHIVNVSSMGGFLPFPGQAIYSASKAAVKAFTEALFAEMDGTPVHVTLVMPGSVNTGIAKNSGITSLPAGIQKVSSQKPVEASTAAALIIKAMEENRFRLLIGKDARMLDRLYRLNPVLALRGVARKTKALYQV